MKMISRYFLVPTIFCGIRNFDARCNSLHCRQISKCHPQVTGMLDESKGTLRLARDGLGDERVPCLPLERLKEAYRTGRGSVCSWRATPSPVNGGNLPKLQIFSGPLLPLSCIEGAPVTSE